VESGGFLPSGLAVKSFCLCRFHYSPSLCCLYPEDRVPPCTSSKSKMKDKMGAHAQMSRGSHILAQGSSGAAMCLVALAPTTMARGSCRTTTCSMAAAPAPGTGQLWDRVCVVAPAPTTRARGSSGTAMCSVIPAPASWRRTALRLPCAPWVGAAGCGLLK
jgi:hypothetical protein